jgi:phosphopentomutase
VPGSGIERAAESNSFPGHGDYRPDQHTREIGYRLLLAQRPALLFIGLGDTDEFAHRNDYDAYIDALVSTDRWLGALTDLGAKLTAQGHPVTFLITTDHGRDAGFAEHRGAPEAARTWLIATGAGIVARGDVAGARQLSDIAPTAAQLLGIPLSHSTGEPIRELLERPTSLAASLRDAQVAR